LHHNSLTAAFPTGFIFKHRNVFLLFGQEFLGALLLMPPSRLATDASFLLPSP
jgi:hypothetical protein